MKQVGCFVCNYNKRDYVLRCVDSLLAQSMDVDIYVVDNASTDDSVDALQAEFGDKITVLVNQENLGGSGGFNSGLRKALELNYKYAVLIDNDVKVAPDAIEIMYQYMEEHQNVGIVGAKILQMQHPDIIQDLGGSLDNHYNMHGNYYGQKDVGLPLELESDYICTCTAMARVEGIRKFGLMPEDNFIYWDDVEWSTKCQLAGYKTVALGNVKVWHNHSSINAVSAFTIYYMTRNRLHYFARYGKYDNMEVFAETMLGEIYQRVAGYYGKRMNDAAIVVMQAFQDFLCKTRWKADSWKIEPLTDVISPFVQSLSKHKRIGIMADKSLQDKEQFDATLKAVLNEINLHSPNCKVDVIAEAEFDEKEYDIVYMLCRHVSEVQKDRLPFIYVDRYCNSITSYDEFLFWKSFSVNKKQFITLYKRMFMHVVEELTTM